MWPVIGGLLSGVIGMISGKSQQATSNAQMEWSEHENQSNAEDANKFSEKMWDKAAAYNTDAWDKSVTYNTGMVAAQNLENRYLVDQAIGEDRAGQARAFAENRSSAERAMDFEERMSSTAYQRSMQDLKASGLNPMLAYARAGASTPNAPAPSAPSMSAPTGAAAGATLHNPTMGSTGGAMAHAAPVMPPVNILGPALASAMQTYRTAAEVRLLSAQAGVMERQAHDVQAYGDSALGRNVGSAVRIAGTAWDAVAKLMSTLKENNYSGPSASVGRVERSALPANSMWDAPPMNVVPGGQYGKY